MAGRNRYLAECVGNVTFAPSYSQISNAEMQSLQASLEQILSQTTSANSIQSVERVYGMLEGHGKNPRFVPAYRDEFRAQFAMPVEAGAEE